LTVHFIPQAYVTAPQLCMLSMTLFAGIAEFERDLIRERTGRRSRRRKTERRALWQAAKLNTDQVQVASQLLAEDKPVRDIARTFNVHEATIYRLAAAS
jgi:DNA invertase Pin-like site-specific DNA recombinase